MKHNFFLLEPPLFMTAYLSFSYIDNTMKILIFFVTIGYTFRRWYLMEKNNKKNSDE